MALAVQHWRVNSARDVTGPGRGRVLAAIAAKRIASTSIERRGAGRRHDQSYYEFCCVDDGICDLVNGVNAEEVVQCAMALEQATCSEIESDFPSECRGITSPDGITPASISNALWVGAK
jgi:hypothetical protein